jgi:hypothetical protein
MRVIAREMYGTVQHPIKIFSPLGSCLDIKDKYTWAQPFNQSDLQQKNKTYLRSKASQRPGNQDAPHVADTHSTLLCSRIEK